MALDDRDYMRRPDHQRVSSYTPLIPRRPWWQKLTWKAILAAIIALAGVVSATAWFLRDASFVGDYVGRSFGPAEGSLIVNINTATTEELETLPGIGPSLARLIMTGRPYAAVEDLERVKGIGPRTVESLRPYVKVEGETEDFQ